MNDSQRMTPPAANGAVPPADAIEQLSRRVAELERQLADVTRERDDLKEAAYTFLAQLHPVDLSEDWLNDPPGRSIAEVAAEYFATHRG
jgi:hypothetical protein